MFGVKLWNDLPANFQSLMAFKCILNYKYNEGFKSITYKMFFTLFILIVSVCYLNIWLNNAIYMYMCVNIDIDVFIN